jgi:uncharacterized membrane protein YeiH
MLLRLLDFIGVAVFAISGALAAGRKRLDLIGVVVLGLVTAVGGGTIRDLLLGRQPIFWLTDPTYILIIVTAALATVASARWVRPSATALLVADALGLALFSIVGAQIAARVGVPAVSCVLLGTVTGFAGGVVRDVLTAEVPVVLRRGNLYASAAVAGTSLYFILLQLEVSRLVATSAGLATVVAIRFASIWWDIHLPVFAIDATAEHVLPATGEKPEDT